MSTIDTEKKETVNIVSDDQSDVTSLNTENVITPTVRDAVAIDVEKAPQYEVKNHKKLEMITSKIVTPSIAVLLTLFLAIIVILYGVFYLGCLWDPISKLKNVPVAILNQDNGFDFTGYPIEVQQKLLGFTNNQTLGELISGSFFNENSPFHSTLKWESIESNVNANDLNDRVGLGDYWAAIIIPSNFSNAFLSNLENKTSHHINPNAFNMTIQFTYDQARQFTVVSIITRAVQTIMDNVSYTFGSKLVSQAEKSPNGHLDLIVVPEFLLKPIWLIHNNIHPVNHYGHNFSTYVGAIVLWLGGMIVTTLLFKIYQSRFIYLHPQIHQPRFKIRYLISSAFMVIFFSFVSSVIFFGTLSVLNGSNTPFIVGNSTSMDYILFGWLFTLTSSLFCCIFANLMGVDNYSMIPSIFLIMQLATSNAILDPIVMDKLTYVSDAFPLTYAVKGFRCLTFGTQCHKMGSYVGVLFIWVGVTGVLNLFLAYRQITKRVIDAKVAEAL
ncbi:hypothetical protein BC833DRAFT_564532 [Globomyces pollinis-pini]|nr:hypothetical protein BC833DRAFT_564532 [Globomyces pollinis-pini]